MVEVLMKLGYTHKSPLEDEKYNNLLNLMWHIISISPEDYHEPRVTERNLVIFLNAIENINVDYMINSYPIHNKDVRTYGYFINESYYFEN